jgi:hypothetical protein
VPETVQIVPADVVPNVNEGLGAFDVAVSVTGPEPSTTVVGTATPNAIVCAPLVIVSVCVTGVVAAA